MNLTEFHGKEKLQLSDIFVGHLGGLIPNAILEGTIGRAFADSATPQFAVLELPKANVSILAGDASHSLARRYLESIPKFSNLFFTSADFAWLLHTIHPHKLVEFTRYAFSAESLDVDHLQTLKDTVSSNIRVEQIGLNLAKQLANRKNSFAEAHMLNFDSPEDFVARGVGFCALENDTIVCVASSFVVCREGIEIQIDTRRSHRNRGIATPVAAHLIAHCLENGMTPGWDAATDISAQFAKKLGYTQTAEYPMLVFTGSKLLVALRNQVQKIKPYIQRMSKHYRPL